MNSLPSALVPLVVVVIVLPPFETTVRPVTLYDPPVFLRSSVRVLAFTCLIAIVSYVKLLPVTLTSVPSYFAVYVALIGPFVRSPVVVTFTPPSDASLVMVRLFTGIGAGVYVDFATLSFQVPMVLSAPKAATVVIARARSALAENCSHFVKPPLKFFEHGCPRSNGAPATTPLRHPLVGNSILR